MQGPDKERGLALCAAGAPVSAGYVFAVWLLVPARLAIAGMPSITFSDIASLRLQAISFFLVGLLTSAAIIQRLWNWLRHDFSWLPRLSYAKACGIVVLWGLLFIIVLTMISGARELMTPGAWKKQGLTYRLRDSGAEPADTNQLKRVEARRERLKQLGVALREYATNHEGHYPPNVADSEVPTELWRVPGLGDLQYAYVAGRVMTDGSAPLAYEPSADGGTGFVLLANGEVQAVEFAEVLSRLPAREP